MDNITRRVTTLVDGIPPPASGENQKGGDENEPAHKGKSNLAYYCHNFIDCISQRTDLVQ